MCASIQTDQSREIKQTGQLIYLFRLAGVVEFGLLYSVSVFDHEDEPKCPQYRAFRILHLMKVSRIDFFFNVKCR